MFLQNCFLPGQDIARNIALSILNENVRVCMLKLDYFQFGRRDHPILEFNSWFEKQQIYFINPTFIKLMNRVQIK